MKQSPEKLELKKLIKETQFEETNCSVIKQIGYHKKEKIIFVSFHNTDKIIPIFDVDYDDYVGFRNSTLKSKYFTELIKKYKTTK